MILVGDIGGTKCHLALFSTPGLRLLREKIYPSENYGGLEAVIQQFVSEEASARRGHQIASICLGVPCPIVQGRCETPNLPWTVSAEAVSQTVGIGKVQLINDLEANGYGISILTDRDLVTLQEAGTEGQGNAALISAGTGLGEALLVKEEEAFTPVASEGGHADFAPRNQLEIELLCYLLNRYRHVSYERVLSGPGLWNIYQFLRDTGRGEEPGWLKEKLEQEDPASVVSTLALKQDNDLCVQALDLLVSIYGAEAGNLALKVKAMGGLYVGGGIAPKIVSKLQDGVFLEAFQDKGRLSSLMKEIPVRVILKPDTALYGAALYAARFISS